jgi:hypothetical protein
MAILPNGPDLAELQHNLPQGVRCEITEDCLRLWWRNWDARNNYGMGCILASSAILPVVGEDQYNDRSGTTPVLPKGGNR